MSGHVTVEVLEDGRTVAVKRATSPGREVALRAEAARLAEIDHPGVVRLVELREGPEGPTLVTEYVGPRTLATVGPVTTDRAAALIAHAATTVADLHATGIVHGAVCPEHVLVAGDHTVLCGLTAGPPGPTSADDVAGIGVTLRSLLDPELEEEPIPDRRPWRRSPWPGVRHRALLTLADQATADEPGRRPSARGLAESVAGLRGGGHDRAPRHDPGPSWLEGLGDLLVIRLRRCGRPGRGRSSDHASPPGSPRRRVLALGGLGLVVLVAGVVGVTRRPLGAEGRPVTVTPPGPGPSCPALTGHRADVDGDGCPEPLRIGPGWVEVDGARYRVGRPGNALAVGDWDCDGLATVALLRRGRGEVWQFTGWDPDAVVTGQAVGTFPGAVALQRRAGAGCDDLEVELGDGRVVQVPTR